MRSVQRLPTRFTGWNAGLKPLQSIMLNLPGATAPPVEVEVLAVTPAAIDPVGLRLNTTAVAPAPAHANHRDQGPRIRSSSSPGPPTLFAPAAMANVPPVRAASRGITTAPDHRRVKFTADGPEPIPRRRHGRERYCEGPMTDDAAGRWTRAP